MGCTKHFCCQVVPHSRSQNEKEWERLRNERQAMMVALEEYCRNDACVPNVSTSDIESRYPEVFLATTAYVAMVKAELSDHSDDIESIRSMKLFATVFTKLFGFPASHMQRVVYRQDDFSNVLDKNEIDLSLDVEGYREVIDRYSDFSPSGEIEAESVKYAELLASSYNKAYLEYLASYEVDNIKVVKHHLTLLADLVDHMMRLGQHVKFRDLEDHPDYELPDDHPHHLKT